MFQNLRTNATLYILHKGTSPFLECGKVVSVKNPRVVYKNLPNGLYPQPVQVVDISVQVGNDLVNLTEMPAMQDTADDVKTGMLVSDSRDEMSAEILTMKQKSEEVLKSVEYHKNFLSSCEQMLAALNPEYGMSQQREQEINALRSQMEAMNKENAELKKQMSDFMSYMKQQFGTTSGSEMKQPKTKQL